MAALEARSSMTRETILSPNAPPQPGGRHRQNGGRFEIGTVGGMHWNPHTVTSSASGACQAARGPAPAVPGRRPSRAALTRLVGAILLDEQDDKWAIQRRCMVRGTLVPINDDPAVSLLAVAI